MRIYILILIILFSNISIFCFDEHEAKICEILSKHPDTFDYFATPLDEDSGYSEINGILKNELIVFSKKINAYIINREIEQLKKFISKTDFRYYGEEGVSENISEKLRSQLSTKKGFYYYQLFDASKKYDINTKPSIPEGRFIDIRKYLLCYKDKLTWRVSYHKERNIYEVVFSIPDWIVQEFNFFRYIVKKTKSGYILVGF